MNHLNRAGGKKADRLVRGAVSVIGLIAMATCRHPSAEVGGAAPTDPAGKGALAQPPAAIDAATCSRNDDCVPATCCHADICVPRAQKPACHGLMCTAMCVPHTIDCGGGCVCESGKCAARLMDNTLKAQ